MTKKKMLSKVKKGEKVKLVEFDDNDTRIMHSFERFGILKGDLIEVISSSYLGLPMCILHENNSLFAIRSKEAKMIFVEAHT